MTINKANQIVKSKISLSIGQQTEEEWAAHKSKIMDTETLKSYNFYIERFEKAKQQREQKHRYFDDMGFVDDYYTNENAKNTYLRAKLNDSEVRVNTGVTEKKIETVINELLSLNLQHEVRAFDKDDNILVELGEDITDLVTRTNKIEEDDDTFQECIIELMTQRAVFIKEVIDERTIRNKKQKTRILKKELLSGLKVFLGDITIPAYRFNEQPYIVEYDRMHWRTAQQIYGHLPKWKEVLSGLSEDFSSNTGAYAYRFATLQQDEVEILIYTSEADNERQLFINGVMMYKPGTDETNIPWEHEGYNITMTVLKSLSPDFAYGKPLTASAKTLQGLSNESLRLMIRKWQQALEPPMGTNKPFSRDVWDPGAVTQGLTEKDFSRLITHDGVTQSEFAMMDFIEKKTQEFIGSSDVQQGQSGKERTTATETLLLQRNATKQLGLAVLAVSKMKRETTKLRVYSLLEEYMKPQGKKVDPLSKKVAEVFQGFTIEDSKFSNEMVGQKRIQFMNRDLTPEEITEVKAHEDKMEKLGMNFRYHSINVNTLKNMFVNWYVVVTPKQKEGSALDKIMFQDQLSQGAAISQLTGTPLNAPVIQESFERKWSAKDWFQTQAPQGLSPMGMGGEEQGKQAMDMEDNKAKAQDILSKLGSLGGSQLQEGIKGGQTQKPSINTMSGSMA